MRNLPAVAMCALLAWGCGATMNRPVDEAGDAAELALLLRPAAPAGRPVPALGAIVVAGSEAPRSDLPAAFRRESQDPLADGVEADPSREPAAPQLDLGLPIALDFGALEAPYDDGAPRAVSDAPTQGGFSSSVMTIQWRRPLPSGLVLQGQASFIRDQELSVLEALDDARFGFVVVGLGVSF